MSRAARPVIAMVDANTRAARKAAFATATASLAEVSRGGGGHATRICRAMADGRWPMLSPEA
eukprot:804903-Prymnesium_polylepis.2